MLAKVYYKRRCVNCEHWDLYCTLGKEAYYWCRESGLNKFELSKKLEKEFKEMIENGKYSEFDFPKTEKQHKTTEEVWIVDNKGTTKERIEKNKRFIIKIKMEKNTPTNKLWIKHMENEIQILKQLKKKGIIK